MAITDIIDDHAPTSPFPHSPLSFTADDIDTISHLSGVELNDVARTTQRLARQAEARTALLAYRIGESIADDMLVVAATRPHTHHAVDKAAIAEISLQLGISRSLARRYAILGAHLTDLPHTTLAFLDGHIRLSRIDIVADHLSILDPSLRAQAEPLALELARRTSADSTLRDQLTELVIALDPDAATDARHDFADRNQNIHIRPDTHGHVTLDGCLPAEQGLHLATRISTLIDERLCADDPRTHGRRRVAALADIQGLPGAHLTCHCGNTTCPATPSEPETDCDTAPFDDTAPLDQPDTGEADAGVTDAGVTEAGEAPAEDLPNTGEANAEVAADSATCDEHHAEEPTAEPAQQTALEVLIDPAGVAVPRLVGFGVIDPAHAAELAAGVIARPVAFPDLTAANLTSPGLNLAAMESNLAAWELPDNPAPPADPTGHGGYPAPPPWALRYRPPDRLRQQVIALHGVCRYPECGKPAEHTELDHLVKFNHADPHAGGWTVLFNLVPLCGPDHQRKHLGFWTPTMHTDLSITWTSTRTGETITTYPR
ncbi:HNH endonuclease signature motif containing protein [Gordonia sputi]|uniref:HNH endonuclease signature motif containing protein n=1 Tax=Gordonia sputi TaxID=36823 RepID=UPI0036AA9BD0